MRLLLEMIENVRKHGYDDMEATTGKTPYKKYPPDKADLFFNKVERCQPFIFTPAKDIKELPDTVDENGHFIDLELDAPFDVFSVEITNGFLTTPKPGAEVPLTIHAVIAYEVSPKIFKYFMYWSGQKNEKRVAHIPTLDVLINQFIERINNQKCGVEKIKESIRIGYGPTRRKHAFKKLIHIRPKTEISERSEVSGCHIEWSHRWLVRGHWRALKQGLGKDRAGNYVVSGFTWVSEHEKGPDNLPLIKKARVQSAQNPQVYSTIHNQIVSNVPI